jgi:hypothetical protein
MKLVKMTKSHVVADVHPDMVEHYQEHGWTIVGEAPASEVADEATAEKPAKKKAK